MFHGYNRLIKGPVLVINKSVLILPSKARDCMCGLSEFVKKYGSCRL